jgi:tetratricopeptide (TPR) repeat protein
MAHRRKFMTVISRLGLAATIGAACGSFLMQSCLAAEKTFIEVRSPNFRVLTDSSDHDGRRIAREFEEMRQVFAISFPNMRLTAGAPLLIFAMHDEHSMKEVAPALFRGKGAKPAGVFEHGWEKQFAVVSLDQDVPGAYQVVYHEYVHSLLHTNFRWLPTWLDEGLAEFYGNTRFDSKKIYIGAPSLRLQHMRNGALIPLETLLIVNPYPFFHGDEERIDKFYSESWALVHYLVFGQNMEGGKKLNRFYAQLQQGDQPVKAFREVFGDLKAVEDGLDRYVSAFAFNARVIDSAIAIQEKTFAARKLSNAESRAEIAGYRMWTHDSENAAGMVDEALKEDPNLGLAHEEKAFLYFHDGKDEDAAREFARAYELDKQRYLSRYFMSMLAAQGHAATQLPALDAGLAQTLEINPQFAPAYVQRAMLELEQRHGEQALSLARKAESIEPSRSGYHVFAGEILLRLKHPGPAAAIAKFVAERWRGPDHNEAVSLWNQIPVDSRPADTELKEEVPEQSQTVEGTLRTVSCGEKGKVDLVLQHGDELLSFRSQGRHMVGYSDTLWYGSDHFNVCHHVEGMHALIRYRPPVTNEYAGDWLSLELRDELPAARDNSVHQNSTGTKESAPVAEP